LTAPRRLHHQAGAGRGPLATVIDAYDEEVFWEEPGPAWPSATSTRVEPEEQAKKAQPSCPLRLAKEEAYGKIFEAKGVEGVKVEGAV
jgi:hypothetical protein